MTSTPENTLNSNSNRVMTLVLMFLCQGLHMIGFGAVPLFLPLIRTDLGLRYTQAGTLIAGNTLVYALMQIPAGYLADRFGPRRVFLVGFFGTSLTILAVGRTTNYETILAIMVLNGFLRSLVFMPGLVLTTGWFTPQRRATAMSGFISSTLSFVAILGLVGPSLVNKFGWRWLFVGLGVVGMVASLIFAWLANDAPQTVDQSPVRMKDALGLFRYRLMWIVAGIQYVRLAVVLGIHFWLPTFLVDDTGLSLPATGVVIAATSLLMAPSNLLGGYVSDRIHRPVLIISVSLGVLTAALSWLVFADGVVLIIALILVIAAFMQLYFGPLFAVPVEVLGPRVAGTAGGFGNLFANLGALTAGFMLGAVRDRTGSFSCGFAILAALAASGLVLALWLAHERRQSPSVRKEL
jgi:DHA1 family inner membrane transport protein